ncbi:MAG: hypothetical protein A2096_16705 [Spirochaetes bacterium GWF1_41_5]|nr:MAG: hypothetical protein A2096_16705 [Spirochaetes bacterium GWF1_41_5]HBE03206.1 radical SAM protein [Spirochaetia bacterium]
MYTEPVFRPPAEAHSLIIQAQIGCPYNRCLFCAMYKSKAYRVKTRSEYLEHLEFLKNKFGRQQRAFIADGDALIIENELLLDYMQLAGKILGCRRFGMYGSVFSLAKKTPPELTALRNAGLKTVYAGLESGHNETLQIMGKNYDSGQAEIVCKKTAPAGLTLSVMFVIGLGGKKFSREHIEASARLLNKISPAHTSLLSLMTGHTPLEHDPGYDISLSAYLDELELFISLTECRTVFRNNHASNYLPLEGILPRDRERLLSEIARARKKL